MAQPPVFPPFSVIGPQFVAQEPLEITVDKFPCRSLIVTDINHKVILKVRPHDAKLHRQRVLLDARDQPIAIIREKSLTMHSRWNVFKGESKDDSDMILTAKAEHAIFRFKTNISVTLANKTRSDDSCDMRIKGSWSKGTCTIYMGESSTAIAQMHKPENLKYAKDKFTVTIQPNMDYAGVVALFAILDAMENPDEVKNGSVGALGTTVDVLGAVGSLSN